METYKCAYRDGDIKAWSKPKEYKGYLIYNDASTWDIVKDGICIAQHAGPRGAREAIDDIIKGVYMYGYPAATKVETLEDLPTNRGFRLPNWNQDQQYRATAWAYLNREDGGLLVYSGGTAYRLN